MINSDLPNRYFDPNLLCSIGIDLYVCHYKQTLVRFQYKAISYQHQIRYTSSWQRA